LPPWAAAAVTLLVLDGAIYFQHVLFHAVPLLWRLHRVHHADLDVDATTGLRFHPLEILLSLGYKATVVVLLGAVPSIVAWVEGLGVWGLLVFVGIYSLAPSLFFPGVVLTLAGGPSLDRFLRHF
jgi:sterol desaturase/sphingolipid hydroxylase (fatty acid hydroxylase superfamily)